MDLLEDEDNLSPEAKMNENMMRQEIWEVLGDVLTPREKRCHLSPLRFNHQRNPAH
jgi:DNA-directed RNA polymerase sigma subunit (sigma70/sigma32)